MFIGLESPVCYSANDTPSDAIFTECTRTRKRLRIGYNSESFSIKSACVGMNPLRG